MSEERRPRKKAKKKAPVKKAPAARAKTLHGMDPTDVSRLFQHHRFMALAATLVVIGLAGVGIGYHEGDGGLARDAPIALTLTGLILLMYRIHRYGRLGSEAQRRHG